MTSDIPKVVEEETDALAEQIFSEWDKWFDGTDDPRRVQLRELQDQILVLEEDLRERPPLGDVLLEANENLLVLKKKIKKQLGELMKEIKPESEKKKQKSKRSRAKKTRNRR